ncbi:MAG: hypothetical protein WCK02_04530 [Bacteroidota bacterium]
MRKILSLLICAFIVLSFSNANAQKKGKSFSGVINYQITYPGADMDPAMAGAMPTSTVLKILEEKQRIDVVTAQMTQTIIINTSLKTSIALLDVMGMYKWAIKSTTLQIDSALKVGGAPKIEVLAETKVIAGYTCKKVTATQDDGTVYSGYFTDEIAGDYDNWNGPFWGLKGTLLEYEVEQNGMTMKYSATEIKKEKPKATDFMMPEGFKVVTSEQLKVEIEQLQNGGQ